MRTFCTRKLRTVLLNSRHGLNRKLLLAVMHLYGLCIVCISTHFYIVCVYSGPDNKHQVFFKKQSFYAGRSNTTLLRATWRRLQFLCFFVRLFSLTNKFLWIIISSFNDWSCSHYVNARFLEHIEKHQFQFCGMLYLANLFFCFNTFLPAGKAAVFFFCGLVKKFFFISQSMLYTKVYRQNRRWINFFPTVLFPYNML